MRSRQVNMKVPVDLAQLIDDVVTDSPFIGGRSALIRHGVELALRDVVDRGVVNDPELSQRVHTYLLHTDQKNGATAR